MSGGKVKSIKLEKFLSSSADDEATWDEFQNVILINDLINKEKEQPILNYTNLLATYLGCLILKCLKMLSRCGFRFI